MAKRSKLPLDEWVHALTATLLGFGAIAIGLLIYFGTEGPTSAMMERIAAKEFWAGSFLLGAFLALCGQGARITWLVRLGHLVAGAACSGVAFAFGIASQNIEIHASQHGMGAYATLAALHVAIAVTFKPPPP